jgi:hypothetical protein
MAMKIDKPKVLLDLQPQIYLLDGGLKQALG